MTRIGPCCGQACICFDYHSVGNLLMQSIWRAKYKLLLMVCSTQIELMVNSKIISNMYIVYTLHWLNGYIISKTSFATVDPATQTQGGTTTTTKYNTNHKNRTTQNIYIHLSRIIAFSTINVYIHTVNDIYIWAYQSDQQIITDYYCCYFIVMIAVCGDP